MHSIIFCKVLRQKNAFVSKLVGFKFKLKIVGFVFMALHLQVNVLTHRVCIKHMFCCISCQMRFEICRYKISMIEWYIL